ncbi:MAG TPA: RNA polymerase sigma-70 factor [Niastella sp.]
MANNNLHNEKELLQMVAGGSEDAFRALFNGYRSRLYTYILKISRSNEIAEDTVHDVFLKLWENRQNLAHVDNLNAYLYRMAHNKAYTGFKRRAKESLILAVLEKEQSGIYEGASDDTISTKEVREFIQQAVNKLTPQQKKVFLLSRQEGLKLDEIATTLQISKNTAKNHLIQALHTLRQEIQINYGSQAIALYVIFNLTIA